MNKLRVMGLGALITAGLTTATSAMAEEKAPAPEHEPSSGGVWINPLGLIIGLVSADVGIAFNESNALNVSASYWSFDLLGVKNTSIGLGAGWQYFIIGDTFGGFYVLPNVQFEYARVEIGDATGTGVVVGPGALTGYQWDWQPFSLRLGGGFHYFIGEVEATSGNQSASSDISGFSLDLDASLGFTW